MLNVMNAVLDKINNTSKQNSKKFESEGREFLSVFNDEDEYSDEDYNLLSELIKLTQRNNLNQLHLENSEDNIITNEIGLENINNKSNDESITDNFLYENLSVNKTIDNLINIKIVEKEIIYSEKIGNILENLDYKVDIRNEEIDKHKISNSLNSMISKIQKLDEFYEYTNKIEDNIGIKLPSIMLKNNNLITNYNLNDNSDKDINLLKEISDEGSNFVISSEIKSNVSSNIDGLEIDDKPLAVRQDYITKDVVKAISYLKEKDIQNLKLNITPKNLGELTINLTKTPTDTKIVITLLNDESFNLINKNLKEIAQHLDNANIQINQIVVDVKTDNQSFFGDNLSQQFREKEKQQENNKGNKNKKVILEEDRVDSRDENISILA